MLWKGHTSDYDVADIKWEGSSSDYAVTEIRGKFHFFLRFCTRKRSKTYTWSAFVLKGFIPLSMLIYMNSVIAQSVRNSRHMFKASTATTGTGKEPTTKKLMDIRQKIMKSAENQLTIMLVLVSTLFIILLLPIYIRTIYVTFVVVTSPSEHASSILFFQITYKLLTTNNGINFFLYCVSGRKFRNDLKEVLCGTRPVIGLISGNSTK